MWEEEKFLLRLTHDSSHYLLFLSFGLLFSHIINQRTKRLENELKSRISLVFTLCIAFGFAIQFEAVAFIFVVAFLLCLLAAIKSPSSAVCTTLILYICRPWEVTEKNDWWPQLPRWCIWIWLFSWLRKAIKLHESDWSTLKFSRGIILILAISLWALGTSIFSRDPTGSFQYYVDTLMRATTLVLIIQLTTVNRDDTRSLQMAFAIGVATLSLFSLWRFNGLDLSVPQDFLPRVGQQSDRRLEAVGSLGNSNDIAAVVMIAMGILLPSALSTTSKFSTRIFATGLLVFLLKTILASQSRGALIASVAQCGIYFVAQSQSPKRLGAFLLLGLLAVAPFASRVMGRNADDLDASTESRLNYYVTGIRMALHSPLWGQGFGRYPYEFERFSTSVLHEWGHRTAHSSWILVLAETGLVGLVLFSWIHVRMFRQSWRLRKSEPGLLLALTGYSITILFLSHSWLMFPWILFTLIELTHKFYHKNEAS